MQAKKEEAFIVDLESYNAEKSYPRSFALYEEYCQKNIAETIRTRRESFEKASFEAKTKLVTKVESEIDGFRIWLEETKGFEPSTAYYFSTSLKSLLLGLPVGMQVARLFDLILNAQTR
jgi:hypothetical protein